MLLVGDLAAMDHHTGDVWLIANAVNYDDSEANLEWAYQDAVTRVEALVAALAQPIVPLVTEPVDVPRPRSSGSTREEYCQMVRDCVEQIRAGEAFQIVPSQRFQLATRPIRWTSTGCCAARTPARTCTCSASPTSPSSAPAPRRSSPCATAPYRPPHRRHQAAGATGNQDAAYEADLLSDEKEAAEHLMLVDLGRNDVGRVSVPGTVKVLEFMNVGATPRHAPRGRVTGTLAPDVQPSTPPSPASPPARSREPRKCARWRSSTSSRRPGEGCTEVPSATSTSPATPTPDRDPDRVDQGRHRVRQAALVSSPTPSGDRGHRDQNKAASIVRAVRAADAMRRWA